MAMLTVADIPSNAVFMSDSQDVAAVRRHLPGGFDLEPFAAYFVIVGDGEYEAVWGICGIVPALERPAYRIL